jgi:uncharacterized damage-inducible protein DinB
MTHYGSKELAQSFRTVRNNTLEAARDIPEDKYDFCSTPDCRSVEKLLTHIEDEGEIWATFLDGVSDEFLAEAVSFPPEFSQPPKSRLEMILSVKEHEMHHRGQVMLIQRMLGIVPHLTRQREERTAQAREAQAG